MYMYAMYTCMYWKSVCAVWVETSSQFCTLHVHEHEGLQLRLYNVKVCYVQHMCPPLVSD